MALRVEAEREIETCRRNRSPNLDLSDLGLTGLPTAVFELTHLTMLKLGDWTNSESKQRNKIRFIPGKIEKLRNLQYLDLSGNQLSTLPESISRLQSLQQLWLRDNQLNALPEVLTRLRNLRLLDLGGNQLSELPETITNLKNLQQLYLRHNQLNVLPEVTTQLGDLQLLDLGGNQLSELPETISHLHNLQKLYLSGNRFSQFPETIIYLDNLQRLYFSYNQLSTLPDVITRLYRLQTLDLRRNRLNTLPESITHLQNLETLDLGGNQLEDPPQEIALKGIKAIHQYFSETRRSSNEDNLFEVKLLLVGEGRAGKTSLAQSLQFSDFVLKDEQSTQGIDIQSWVLTSSETDLSKDLRLNIWDFGGQEIYHQTHQFFLTKRSLYLLVTESRRDNQNEDFYYWLNIIRLLGADSPVILVLNKCDQPTKALPVNEYQLAFENLVEFHQVSCHPDYKSTLVPLREAIRRIITNPKLMPHVGSKLPGVWVRIREEIAKLRDVGQDFISRDDYLGLCAHYDMNEERADFLSDFFHDIGVFLHFKDDLTLRDTVILNHEWVTVGVYRVLDSQRVIDQKGRFSDADLIHIWHDEKYKHKRAELRSLMMNRKFELIYELPSGGYLAPQLLPVDESTYEWRNGQANLRFEYRYKFMPKGILTRFVVKQHRDIFRETHWRYGVLLDWEDTRALVRERYFERKITIQLDGPNQRGFLDIIRKTIDEIHSSFNNLEVQEMIPCHCDECSESASPHFFDYAILRRFLHKRKPTVTCEKSVEEVDIRTLISETVLPEREKHDIYYHIEGDYVGGDKVGNDKTQATIEDSENVIVGKRSRIRREARH